MNSGFNLVRWLRVIMLGGVLGLAYVYISLFFWGPPEKAASIHSRTEGRDHPQAPFKFSGDQIEQELDRVIQAQLRAFRKDDYPKAYQYAASGLKAQLPLPAFERMVKSAYPLIARSRSEVFGVSIDNGDVAMVNVVIVGASGRVAHYQYLLRRERAGWRINGVAETRPQGITL
jgi:hypothetical protein